MLKSKKAKIVMIVILIVVIIAIILFFVYKNSIYSLERVNEILTSINTLNNVHIKEEIFVSNKTSSNETTNYYVKDNNLYINQNNKSTEDIIEVLYDFENKKRTTIVHTNKTITISDIAEDDKFNLSTDIDSANSFFTLANLNKQYEHRGIYKYLGKEDVDGKKCIKVSLTDNYEDKANVNYYYIDLENNYIVKYEAYEGKNKNELNKSFEKTYTYSFNTVTDEDILKFNRNDYQDYEYCE